VVALNNTNMLAFMRMKRILAISFVITKIVMISTTEATENQRVIDFIRLESFPAIADETT